MATAGTGARSGRRRPHDQYGRMEAWFGSVPTGVAAAAAGAADAAQCVTSPFVTSPRRTHPATAERGRERAKRLFDEGCDDRVDTTACRDADEKRRAPVGGPTVQTVAHRRGLPIADQ